MDSKMTMQTIADLRTARLERVGGFEGRNGYEVLHEMDRIISDAERAKLSASLPDSPIQKQI